MSEEITQENRDRDDALIRDIVLEVFDQSKVNSAIAMFAYQEFDPKRIVIVLERKRLQNGVADSEHKKNMFTLAKLGLEKGYNLRAIWSKSTGGFKKFLTRMISKYDITLNKPTNNSTVTLRSIAILYTGTIVKKIAKENLVIRTTIEPSTIAPNFPAYMCISTFGYLIPKPSDMVNKADLDLLVSAFCYHQYLLDRFINSKNQEVTSLMLYNITLFVCKQYSSDMYDSDTRIKILLECEILVKDGEEYFLSSSIRTPLTIAASKYKELHKQPINSL